MTAGVSGRVQTAFVRLDAPDVDIASGRVAEQTSTTAEQRAHADMSRSIGGRSMAVRSGPSAPSSLTRPLARWTAAARVCLIVHSPAHRGLLAAAAADINHCSDTCAPTRKVEVERRRGAGVK